MPTNHAFLSPSGVERWGNCPPSAKLESLFPDRRSDAADEGTLAHTLGELLIKQKLNLITKVVFKREHKKIQENGFYDAAMQGYCEDYATFVLERYAEAKALDPDARIMLERQVDLRTWIPEGFGTLDNSIVGGGILWINDLKYGKGVNVSVVRNKQTMTYALGSLEYYAEMYDIHTVRLGIFQPRLDNISSWDIDVDELRAWGENWLTPRAALAFAGEGDYEPGLHCRFCRAAGNCKANAAYNLEIAKHDFKNPDLLTEEEISEILDKLPTLMPWVKKISGHALTAALEGAKYPGYKIVAGKSNRTYADEEKIVTILKDMEFTDEQIFNKKIKGIGDMEKLLGKPTFKEKLTDAKLVVKPKGAPALVPDYDERPAINSIEDVLYDFKDVDANDY